ncbi:MAG: multicopper oxidase domain-containing protein, partial [Euryarchaeota archaeon]|nr:multicopper oxidase domain-containing protein [Euryarchaeota archaeon]
MRGLIVGAVLVSMLLTGCSGKSDGLQTSTTGSVATAAEILDRYIDFPANGNVVEIDLYVTKPVHVPYEGGVFYGLAFGFQPDGSDASIPGPEIRLTQGDTLRARLHVTADHQQPHTIHWHGITLPWEMDGVPMMTQSLVVGSDSVYTYEWVAREPGTYWYHCHVEAPAHVDAGMFGALIVEPADKSEDLPYDRDHTLILHETDSRTDEFLTAPTTDEGRQVDPYREHPFHAIERVEKNAEFMVDIAGFIAYAFTGQENWAENAERDYYPFASIRYRPHYDTFMINGKSYP